MNPDDPVKLLKRMLEIYSPSGKEDELAAFLKDEMTRLGFGHVRTDKVGNIYGEIGSGSPAVLLCGHMDTVPGKIPVKTEANKLYGRGAADAKAPLAAMISAASKFAPNPGKGRIVVAGVVEEERTAKGIRQLISEGLRVDYAFFGEPSGLKNITFAYKGRLGLKITCRTESGHVGAQHLLENAIEISIRLWGQLKDACETHKSSGRVFYSLTPCITRINSLRTSGGVPDVCIMDVDLRLPPPVKCADAIALIKDVANSFQKETPSQISLSITDRIEPFVARRDTEVMKALEEAIREVTGSSVEFLRKTGTGDMNIFGAEVGVPVATYGPGNARLSHTANEYIGLSEYLLGIRVYEKAVERLLSRKFD